MKKEQIKEMEKQVDDNWQTLDFGNPQRGMLPVLTNEVGRLEKKWKLA